MTLSNRQKRIIRILAEASGPLKVKEMAECLSVSARTIRYDLDEIDYYLKKVDEELVRKPRVGISLRDPEYAISELLILENSSKELPYLNKEERSLYLGLYLATTDKVISSEALADALGISRSAILSDLKDLAKQLENVYDIKLTAKKHYGYMVEADEKKYRRWLGDLVHLVLEMKRDGQTIYLINDSIAELIEFSDVQKIRTAMKIVRNNTPFWVPYSSYLLTVSKIKVILWRMHCGNPLKLSEKAKLSIKSMEVFEIAKQISEEIDDQVWPEYEILNLAYDLASCNLKISDDAKKIVDPKLIDTVYEMIREIQSDVKLSADAVRSLKLDLVSHLDHSLEKLQLNMPNVNQLLPEIRELYQKEFFIAKKILKIFDEAYCVFMSDDEAGFIAMHIAKNRELTAIRQQKRVLIVCGSGRGASRLLATRIRNNITNLHVASIASVFEIEENEYDMTDIDLIISTIKIKKMNKPVVQVSPLITDSELGQISKTLFDKSPNLYLSQEKEQSDITEINMDAEAALSNLIGMVLIEISSMLGEFYKEELIKEEPMKQWGLTLHIVMAIPRWRSGRYNVEPDLEKARKMKPDLYNRINQTLKDIEIKYDMRIPEAETVAVMRYLI